MGVLSASEFDTFSEQAIRGLAAIASPSPIPASTLVVNDVFVAVTNGNNLSKLIVTRNAGGELQLMFTTFLASASGNPSIKQVLNNSSQIAPSLPNYGIAPSSIFIVTGSSLADAGDPVLQSSAAPGLPQTLNGASIAVVVNGVTTRPGLYYTSPGQLAAVLPANTPVGNGTLTVTHNGITSPSAPIQVVPSAVGINTYGANSGVATDAATGAIVTYANSGAPGQAIVLWTTGLGANPSDSDTIFTSTPHSVSSPLQVYVGGVQAQILYQGSAGYPGVNQINIVIPDSVPTGCWISLAAVTGSVVSNIATLPINIGGGACLDPQTGLNGSQLQSGGGLTLKAGLVSLILPNTQNNAGVRRIEYSAAAAFVKYTGLSYDPPNSVSPGGCILTGPAPIPGVTGMDPGAISLTGPGGLSVNLRSLPAFRGNLVATLPAGAIPATGGSFSFTGTGGADVGSFTSTLNPVQSAVDVDQSRRSRNHRQVERFDGHVDWRKPRVPRGDQRRRKRYGERDRDSCWLLMPGPRGSGAVYRAPVYSAGTPQRAWQHAGSKSDLPAVLGQRSRSRHCGGHHRLLGCLHVRGELGLEVTR